MNRELLSQAHECLNIKAIFLRESRLTMREGFVPTDAIEELGLQTKIGLKSFSTGTRFDDNTKQTISFVRGIVEAGIRLVSAQPTVKEASDQKDDGANVAAELVASFLAEYDLVPGKDLSPEALNEFLKVNAVHHAWTYWREYVQSTFARAMLPQITLPMLLFKPTPKTDAPKSET